MAHTVGFCWRDGVQKNLPRQVVEYGAGQDSLRHVIPDNTVVCRCVTRVIPDKSRKKPADGAAVNCRVVAEQFAAVCTLLHEGLCALGTAQRKSALQSSTS